MEVDARGDRVGIRLVDDVVASGRRSGDRAGGHGHRRERSRRRSRGPQRGSVDRPASDRHAPGVLGGHRAQTSNVRVRDGRRCGHRAGAVTLDVTRQGGGSSTPISHQNRAGDVCSITRDVSANVGAGDGRRGRESARAAALDVSSQGVGASTTICHVERARHRQHTSRRDRPTGERESSRATRGIYRCHARARGDRPPSTIGIPLKRPRLGVVAQGAVCRYGRTRRCISRRNHQTSRPRNYRVVS